MCVLAAETSVSSLSTIPLNHGSRVVKSLKQNRAKSRIAWNNVVPANVHEEDWPPSIVMGAWLQSTLHTGPAPCLYQYLSFACTQAHGAEYTVRVASKNRCLSCTGSPETVNFIANRYLGIVEPPRFIQHWWRWYFEFHFFEHSWRTLFLEIRINWSTCCCCCYWDSYNFVISMFRWCIYTRIKIVNRIKNRKL